MAEAIGTKAIRVVAQLRRNTGRRHISVADAIANAVAASHWHAFPPSPCTLWELTPMRMKWSQFYASVAFRNRKSAQACISDCV